jgi:hypothetical protein
MKKSLMYAIVAVVIIIIVIAGVAAWYYTGGMGGGGAATPTPSTTPVSVADATSLSFNSTVAGVTYVWQGNNIHSNDVVFRVDLPGGYSYILNAGTQKAWESTDGGATWTAGDFATDWTAWSGQWTDFVSNLVHWNGADATYPVNDATVGDATVSAIVVNPTIPAATFNQ